VELSPETPIKLVLQQLEEHPGWQLLRQRLEELEERRLREVTQLPADADPREIQRLLGFIEGLRAVLDESGRTVKIWERKVKQSNTAARAAR
jgi:DNA-binding HxlR family transcriptional regulator